MDSFRITSILSERSKEMDRFISCKERLANFDPDKRFKFEFIFYLATIHSNIRVAELIEQYLIRRRVALTKYKDFTAFEYDELYKANDNLTGVNLPCDLMKFYGELRDIDHEIETAKNENKYDQVIDHHYNMIYLFASILFEAQLDEYLNTVFDFDITIPYYGKYDIRNLKDFDKVVELLARFKWIVKLKNMIETADYNGNKTKLLEELNPEPEKDWKELYNDLINGHYIADCSLSEFNMVMNGHTLSPGKNKIKWIGTRNNGFWFGKFAGFDVKTLNKLFIPSNGKPFRNNDNTICKIEFEQLMLRYFPKIQ